MEYYSVRDLRIASKSIWESLSDKGEVIITNNGKPTALMVDITGKDAHEMSRAITQARAMIAINSMRKKAADAGFMTDEEIQAEIEAARKERMHVGRN